MSIDESKSDSSKILPKINWENKNGKKSPLTKKEQSFEGLKALEIKEKYISILQKISLKDLQQIII